MDSVTNKNFLKAVQYFPKWMQIRRRPFKSTGGKLLLSIIEEMTDIYREIENYEKSFFLVNYAGKEEDIVAYLYTATIGNLSNNLILDNEYVITKDLNDFYDNEGRVYYEDGKLFFKINDINEDNIGYSIGQFHYTVPVTKESVWNIFDEFAWFAGIDRLPEETNTSLVNRTYDALRTKNNKNNNILFDDITINNAYKHRFNSTEFGLKYLIKNLLSAYTGILFKDIEINELNEVNIHEKIDDQSIYDYISQLNKDIAREKVWDLTFWENQFKKMGYLPHIWDQPITYYQQGVGYFDSLEVTTSNAINDSETTDVAIYGYKKSMQKASQYLLNSDKRFSVTLDLKKYNLDLKPVDIQYNIKATTAQAVNPKDIIFRVYDVFDGTQSVPLEEIIDVQYPLTGITVKQGGILENNTDQEVTYKVMARPKYAGGNIAIKNFLIDNNDVIDTIYNNQYFVNNNHTISYVDNYFYGTKLMHFASSTNMYNVKDGIAVDTTKSTKGSLTIPLEDIMTYSTINFGIDDTLTDITNRQDIIQSSGFVYDRDNKYWVVETNQAGTLSINQVITDLEFDINQLDNEENTGSVRVTIKDQQGQLVQQDELNTYSLNKHFVFNSNTNEKLFITIEKIGTTGLKLFNIKATSHNVEFVIDNKPVQKTLDTYSIPDNINNKVLTINVYSYLGISKPVIKYISIAGEYANFRQFEYDIVIPPNSNKQIKIKATDTVLSLYKNDELIDDNYTTNNSFTGPGRAVINIERQNILESTLPFGTEAINGRNITYLDLDNQERTTVDLTSKGLNLFKADVSLFDMLTAHTDYDQSNDRVYVTANNTIIVYNNNGTKEPFTEFKALIEYINYPFDYIEVVAPDSIAIQLNHDTNHLINENTSSSYNKLYSVSFSPRTYTTHVLSDTDTIIQAQKTYTIDRQKFVPSIDNSKVYLLEVNLPDNYNATTQYLRYNYSNNEKLERWCLFGNGINIITPQILVLINYWNENSDNYNVAINKKLTTTLFSTEQSLEDSYRIDDTNYNLSEFIITPPNYLSVVYDVQHTDETQSINEDGLVKLKNSNIVNDGSLKLSISGQELTDDDYVLYNDYGIIQVIDVSKFNSLTLHVEYLYKHPDRIVFNSVDELYRLIENNTEAYEVEYIDTVKGLHDNESKQVLLPNDDTYVKFFVDALNPLFTSIISNNVITTYRVNGDNKIIVKPGYYYDNGKEYYYGVNETKIERKNETYIDFENSDKQGNYLITNMARKNLIPNSSMSNQHLTPLFYANFKEQKEISAVSSLNALTTANTFNLWTFVHCDPTLIEQNHNYVIDFKFENNGYALIDITSALQLNTVNHIYPQVYGDIKVTLAKEFKINGFTLQKKPLINIIDGLTIEPEENYHYYLIITGTQGQLEEIVVTNKEFNNPHKKNIDLLGWDIDEVSVPNEPVIMYDNFNASTTDLDIDDSGIIHYGTTIDYDATFIGTSDFTRCQLDKTFLRNNSVITLDEEGSVTTEVFDLFNRAYEHNVLENIANLIVKVNTINDNKYVLDVQTSSSLYGRYHSVGAINNNYALLNESNFERYVKVTVTIPPNESIDSIEVYVVYKESNKEDIVIQSLPYESGQLISRIFNISNKGSYSVSYIDGSINGNAVISIRALRQNGLNSVFTDWYELKLDANNKVLNNIIFNNTDTFQIKVRLLSQDTTVELHKIGLTTLSATHIKKI